MRYQNRIYMYFRQIFLHRSTWFKFKSHFSPKSILIQWVKCKPDLVKRRENMIRVCGDRCWTQTDHCREPAEQALCRTAQPICMILSHLAKNILQLSPCINQCEESFVEILWCDITLHRNILLIHSFLRVEQLFSLEMTSNVWIFKISII